MNDAGRPAAGTVRVTLLVDNRPGAAGLREQWGLSAWVETDRAHVLVDSGLNEVFAANARALGVPLETADAFVLSHGHPDHTGGLARGVEEAPGARLVLHPGALAPRYWLGRTGKVRAIGMSGCALDAVCRVHERVTWAAGPVEVAPDVWASGPVPRRCPLEEAERNFFLDPACTLRDHVVDDQALWVETPKGLVVLVGCAHAGIVNTLDYVRALVAGRVAVAGGRAGQPAAAGLQVPLAADGLPRVRAVIGGLHLLHAKSARLRATVEALRQAEVGLLAPVHCTGRRGTRFLRETLPDAFVAGATGSVFIID